MPRARVCLSVSALTDSDLFCTGRTSMGTTGGSALLQARTTTTYALQECEYDRVRKSTAHAMKTTHHPKTPLLPSRP